MATTPTPQIVESHFVKICVIGDEKCGKSALVHQFINKEFDFGAHTPTIEERYKDIELSLVGGLNFNMTILDTAGNEQFQANMEHWIGEGHVVIIVYSLVNINSFYKAEELLAMVEKQQLLAKHKSILLVGTHLDHPQRLVPTSDLKRLSDKHNNIPYFEIDNHDAAFTDQILEEALLRALEVKNAFKEEQFATKRKRRTSFLNFLEGKDVPQTGVAITVFVIVNGKKYECEVYDSFLVSHILDMMAQRVENFIPSYYMLLYQETVLPGTTTLFQNKVCEGSMLECIKYDDETPTLVTSFGHENHHSGDSASNRKSLKEAMDKRKSTERRKSLKDTLLGAIGIKPSISPDPSPASPDSGNLEHEKKNKRKSLLGFFT